MFLTRKEIGQRIAAYRKVKGYSQEDLAGLIKMSRPSLAQIELGNRNIDLLEFQQLALVLGFSLDEFVAAESEPGQETNEPVAQYEKKARDRISQPAFSNQKFSNVLLYIMERCAGKPNVGETVLAKLLYFSDFNYYELYEEHLSGARYRKMPYGPVPDELDTVIQQMITSSQIQRIKSTYFGYAQTRFIPLVKSDLRLLKASEKEVIDRVIEHMSDWSASAISDYSHKDLPWLASKEGEEIDYELVFYRELPFSVRNYNEDEE